MTYMGIIYISLGNFRSMLSFIFLKLVHKDFLPVCELTSNFANAVLKGSNDHGFQHSFQLWHIFGSCFSTDWSSICNCSHNMANSIHNIAPRYIVRAISGILASFSLINLVIG